MTTDTALALGFVYVMDDSDTTKPANHQTIRYDQFVRRLFKVMPLDYMKFHAVGGVCEEAGELHDVVKRELIYKSDKTSEGKSIREGLIEEMGDLRFYIQAVMQVYEISEHEILQGNADKLSARYKKLAYSDASANARADKSEVHIPPASNMYPPVDNA